MTSKASTRAVILLISLAVMSVLGEAGAAAAAAAACDPTRLTPCAGPVLFGGAVPAACCAQLRAQQGCLCEYAGSPNYGGYVNSPNARSIFPACRLPLPHC